MNKDALKITNIPAVRLLPDKEVVKFKLYNRQSVLILLHEHLYPALRGVCVCRQQVWLLIRETVDCRILDTLVVSVF